MKIEQAESQRVEEGSISDHDSTDRRSRMNRLSKELDEIMQSVFVDEDEERGIDKIKQQHACEIHSLKLNHHLINSQNQFKMHQMQLKVEQLEYQKQFTQNQNIKLKEIIAQNNQSYEYLKISLQRAQKKIKNQQLLIDEYKNSLEEQIALEKQVILSTFQQRQRRQKNKFDEALRAMEKNYQNKMKQVKQNYLKKEIQGDLKTMKRLCKDITMANKENVMRKEKKSQGEKRVGWDYNDNDVDVDDNIDDRWLVQSKGKGGISSYSTLARQN